MTKAWLVLLLAPLVGCPGSGQSANGSTAANGSTTAPPFSADSAYAYLRKQVSFGPRVPGMPGDLAQLDWMLECLRARADTVIRQNFTHTHTRSGMRLPMTNLLGRFNPGAGQRILLLAHWDTRPTADSESDD